MQVEFNQKIAAFLSEFKKHPTLKWIPSILWLGLILGIAFLWQLGTIGLIDETEPLFAEAARQMTVTGDWITPYFNEQTRFDKPPLIYWLMAIAYKIGGVNAWSVRFPSVLAAIVLTLLGFYVLWQYEQRVLKKIDQNFHHSPPLPFSLPWMGAGLIALNPETIAWARTGVSDMLLTGCMCGALLVFFLGYTQGYFCRWYGYFYVLIALAILAKGPVGLVLPGLIIGSFTLYLGNFKQVWREIKPWRGIAIILGLTLPWYIAVTMINGEAFIDSFFGYHNVQRFTQVVNRHWAPWYFYFVVVLVGFFPYSVYLPLAISHLKIWQRNHWSKQSRWEQFSLFLFFWFAVIFVFFTIAVTKLPSYVLPLMPACALFVSLFWYTTDSITRKNRFFLLSSVGNILMALGMTFLLIYGVNWVKDPTMPNFAEMFEKSGVLIWGSWIWGITALLIIWSLWKQKEKQIIWINCWALMIFLVLTITPVARLVDQERQLPLRELAQLATRVKVPGEEVIMIGFAKPSVVFYSQAPVVYYKRLELAVNYMQSRKNEDPPTVLVLSEPDKLKEASLKPGQYQLLGKAGVYQLIRLPK